MVIGNIKHCDKYYPLHKHFKDVFEYLKEVKKEDGKYVISEGNAWVNSPVKRDICSDIYETHRKFIDIHYVFSGNVIFGCCDASKLEVIEEYDEEKEYEFLKGQGNLIEMSEGDFIIVFPEDAHNIVVDFDKSKELVTVVAKVRIMTED